MRAMPNAPLAAQRIETARLHLVASDTTLVAPVLAFYTRNAAHFGPWNPPLPPDFVSTRRQRERLSQDRRAFAAGEAFRYWLLSHDDPSTVIGQVHFSSVARGPFQCAMLGYQLDGSLQGHGLMHEALQSGIAEMFSPRVALHRLQAAHLPENRRSAAVLARLGFEREGVARRYLFIHGAWRDHVIHALLNDTLAAPVQEK